MVGRSGACPIVSRAGLARWAAESTRDDTHVEAERIPRHPRRQLFLWPILEHDVAKDVVLQREKGLRVPPWFVIDALLRMWSALPQSADTSQRLARIAKVGARPL